MTAPRMSFCGNCRSLSEALDRLARLHAGLGRASRHWGPSKAAPDFGGAPRRAGIVPGIGALIVPGAELGSCRSALGAGATHSEASKTRRGSILRTGPAARTDVSVGNFSRRVFSQAGPASAVVLGTDLAHRPGRLGRLVRRLGLGPASALGVEADRHARGVRLGLPPGAPIRFHWSGGREHSFPGPKIELCSWARAAVVDAAVAASWTLGLASDRRRTAAAALALESTGSGGREHSFPSPKFKWRSWGRAALPLWSRRVVLDAGAGGGPVAHGGDGAGARRACPPSRRGSARP